MPAIYIYEPVIKEFSNESSVTVDHFFGRNVNVQVINSDNEVILADILKDGLSSITASFYEKGSAVSISGVVVVS
jgi:hypothetical protein